MLTIFFFPREYCLHVYWAERESQPYIFCMYHQHIFYSARAIDFDIFFFFFYSLFFLTVSSRLFPKTKILLSLVRCFVVVPSFSNTSWNHAFIVVAPSTVNRWTVFIKFTIHNNKKWKKFAQFTWKSNLLEQYWCWWMSIITFDSIALPYCCDHCKVGSAWVFFFVVVFFWLYLWMCMTYSNGKNLPYTQIELFDSKSMHCHI